MHLCSLRSLGGHRLGLGLRSMIHPGIPRKLQLWNMGDQAGLCDLTQNGLWKKNNVYIQDKSSYPGL